MKIETKTVHTIDYKELEELVNSTYGFEAVTPVPAAPNYKEWPYNFVAIEECSNDSSHEFHIDGYVCEYDNGELAKWVDSGGKSWVSNYVILDDLCRQGLIPEGDYIVRVSW